MTLEERLENCLGSLQNPSAKEMKDALTGLDLRQEELLSYLVDDENKPYSRTMLFRNKQVELIAMKWSENMDCAPHDHGQSIGWIKVVSGISSHTIYRVPPSGLPNPILTKKEPKGRTFYAPKKLVHKMGSAGNDPLVTLHLYSPPITGMKVYDLEKCAACIVADDCGAWWPEEQKQKVKEMKLIKVKPFSGRPV